MRGQRRIWCLSVSQQLLDTLSRDGGSANMSPMAEHRNSEFIDS